MELIPYDALSFDLFPGGAQFGIYTTDEWDGVGDPPAGVGILYTVSKDHPSASIDIAPGDYYIAEITAPSGTEKADGAKRVTVTSNNPTDVSFTNNATLGLVKFTKYLKIGSSNEPASGISFTLTDTTDSLKTYHGTSNNDGTVYIAAPEGNYTLREDAAPEGYINMTPRAIAIEAGATTLIPGGVVNLPAKAKVTIKKYVVDRLEGVTPYAASDGLSGFGGDYGKFKFTLSFDPDGDGVPESREYTMDSSGTLVIDNLPRLDSNGNPVQYTLKENALTGSDALIYDADDAEKAWSFSDSDETFEFFNRLKGELQIKKQVRFFDANGVRQTSVKEGAAFKLYKKNGDGSFAQVGNGQSDANGLLSFKGLAIKDDVGTPIHYYVVEDDLPGYAPSYNGTGSGMDSVTGPDGKPAWPVALTAGQKVTNLTANPVVNVEQQGALVIEKKDIGGLPLSGAAFTITRQGSEESWARTTGADGRIVLSPVAFGTYEIEETTPPANYLKDPGGIQTVTFGEATTYTRTFVNRKKPLLTVTKTKKDLSATPSTVQPYGGVDFAVYTKNGATFEPVAGLAPETGADGVTAFYLPDAGTYYLREDFPADVVTPSMDPSLFPSPAYETDGVHHYRKVADLALDNAYDLGIENLLNKGKLTITKKDRKSGATVTAAGTQFTVAVTPPDSQSARDLLVARGFAAVGGGRYARTVSAANGVVAIDNLPVYAPDGTNLGYNVTEAAAPTGYFLSAESVEVAFAETGSVAYQKSAQITDVPKAQLTVGKDGYRVYGSDVHKVDRPLGGAELSLYRAADNGDGTLTLSLVEKKTTGDPSGTATFTELDGLTRYAVFESATPEGYDFPDTKTAAGDLSGTYSAAAYNALFVTHNGFQYNFGATASTPNSYTTSDSERLDNARPYAQFRVEKVDADDHLKKLDHAKFTLYASDPGDGVDFSALNAAGKLTKVGTFETGTQGEGLFSTGELAYGLVYWLAEELAPSGYVPLTAPIGPIVADNSALDADGRQVYTKNSLTPFTIENEWDEGGSGTDARRFVQIKLNKMLVPEGGGANRNLPGVTFDVYLADALGNRVGTAADKLASVTTGNGMALVPGDPQSVAGTAITESIDMAQLFSQYGAAGHVSVSGSGSETVYRAKFLLVESAYPADVTPRQTNYLVDVVAGPEVYTTNTQYHDNPILNDQVRKVPVTVRKWGHRVNDTTKVNKVPLAGAQIGVYLRSNNSKVMEGVTNEYGYLTFQLEPNKTDYYYIKEIWAPTGYQLDTNTHNFNTLDYGSTVLLEIYDPEYRELQIQKNGPTGAPLANAKFQILQKSGSSWIQPKDANGANMHDEGDATRLTITTGSDGTASIRLPYNTYRLVELSVGGTALTATEQAYFHLVNSAAASFTWTNGTTDLKQLPLVNPGTGSLALTKVDDRGVGYPVANVKFKVSFKAFLGADQSAATTADTGFLTSGDWSDARFASFDEIEGSGNRIWKTDLSGQINKTGLLPGWYRLEELVPTDYVAAVAPVIVKVTAKGIWQSADASALIVSAPKDGPVVNTRKGYLMIEKAFAESELYRQGDRGSVTFDIYKGATLVETVTLTIGAGGTGESPLIKLDPGAYAIRERSGPWYGHYTVTDPLAAEPVVSSGWLDASAPVTVSPGNTAEYPVVARFENKPDTAQVVIHKTTENGQPLQHAVFALYYRLGDNPGGAETFFKDGNGGMLTATTDSAGSASLTVLLPKDRVVAGQTQYFLREIAAPERYALAADVPVALEPGTVRTPADQASLNVVDRTGVIIGLTKYWHNRANFLEGGEDSDRRLGGATFELYRVDLNTKTGIKIATAVTDGSGQITFGNLEKLEQGVEAYYLRESATPYTHVADSLELYGGEQAITPEAVSVEGAPVRMFPVAVNDDVTLQGFNTPKGSIIVLKYNYIYPADADKVPIGASFGIDPSPVQNVIVGQYDPSLPEMLDGGYSVATQSGKRFYADASGTLFSSGSAGLMAPGTYEVVENSPGVGFLDMRGEADPSAPWYTRHTVVVGDEGKPAVVRFANVPSVAIQPNIVKTVVSPASIDASLQDGPQTVTFQLDRFGQTDSNPFRLPVTKLTVEDNELSFTGKGGVPAQVQHRVIGVTVGEAHFPSVEGSGEVQALVYGMNGADAALVATLDVTGGAQAVDFGLLSTPYTGVRVEYVAKGENALIQPGFAAGPILVRMEFFQAEGQDIELATSIRNTAMEKLSYKVGNRLINSDEVRSSASVPVSAEKPLPKGSLVKSAVKLDQNGVNVVSTDDPLNVKPGDWVRYTLTFKNESAAGSGLDIKAPVIVDMLPALVLVDVANVTVESTDPRLTGFEIGEYTGADLATYVSGKADGLLGPQKTMTMTLRGLVRTASVLQLTSSIQNTAYATSRETIRKNKANPNGTPFTEVGMAAPFPATPLEGATFGGTGTLYALNANKNMNLQMEGGVSVYKLVAADRTGIGNYVSGDEHAIASVNSDGAGALGKIKYRIVVVNGNDAGSATITNLRVVDKMPREGDTDFGGSLRYGAWPVALVGNFSVSSSRTGSLSSSQYTLRKTSGMNDAAYRQSVKDGSGNWDGGSAGFMIDLGAYQVLGGERITIEFEASAPTDSEVENGDYFENSVNHAYAGFKAGLTQAISSGPAKVILMPQEASLGNRVWIDVNGNGVQDGEGYDDSGASPLEPTYAGGGIAIELLEYVNREDKPRTVRSVTLGGSGFFRFDGLTPAELKDAAASNYTGGNIKNGSLKSDARTSYQLRVTGIPEGYVVTAPFARNGGTAPNYESTDSAGRFVDSNFKPSGGAYYSEKFYLRPNEYNPSFDLGLCRVRDLEITKTGEGPGHQTALEGVKFSIHGPFESLGGITVDGANKFGEMTTDASGVAVFESGAGNFLNYYMNYVVVETQAVDHYDATAMTATGGDPSVTQPGGIGANPASLIIGSNYFVLPAKTNQTQRRDEVRAVNPYRASGSLMISGTKALSGRDLEDDDFSFRLVDVTGGEPGAEVAVTHNTGGSFVFPRIDYTQDDIGTHTYRVTEVNGGLANHEYDGKVYTVAVTVADSVLHDGELIVSKAITFTDAEHPEAAAAQAIGFVNRFSAAISVPVEGAKALGGRALEEGEFAFELYANAAEGTPLQTAYNDADGRFAFDPLEYTEADIGETYVYQLRENPAAGSHGALDNHTYDAKVYTITVTVGYDGATGRLTTAVKRELNGSEMEADDELAFENNYADTISETLGGGKTLSGRAIADGDFSFKLTDVTNSASPMDVSTVQNVGGTFRFPALQYDQDDIGKTYTYWVSELNRGVGGFAYDTTVYTVTVAIGYDAATGELTKLVRTYKNGARTPEQSGSLDFANGYQAIGAYAPVGTKALEGRAQLDGMFRFEVRDDDNAGALVATGVSGEDGQITFTPIQYRKNAARDDTGMHRYTITEIAGNDQGIDDTGVIYSAQSFPLTVVVDDEAGNGRLRVQASYPGGSAAFKNGTEKVDVKGRKVWTDQSNLYARRPENVTVYLLADGAQKDSVTLSGAGDAWSYSFQNLPRYDYGDPYDVREIEYTVDESAVPGYHKAIGAMVISVGEGGRRVLGCDITNAIRLLNISKRTGGGARLAGATLALYRVQNGARTLIESFRTTAGGDHVVSGLEPGSYVLVETVVPAGYVRAADIAINVAEDGKVTSSALTGGVIRMVDELIPTANVTGTKTWVDMGNQGGLRPENIEITLYADGAAVVARPTWTKNGDIWTYTFAGLNVYRAGNSGPRIVYTVREAPVAGYTATYNGLSIINQMTDIEVRYVEISGLKTWVDDGDTANARPDSITVYLLRNGTVIDTRVVTEADGWAYSFGDLPDSDGHMTSYAYTVNEKTVPGYARSVRDFDLTNTYVPPEGPPTEPKKPNTPGNWEELLTLLDADVPLYGGLLKTGEETPLYPYVFGGLGLIALIAAMLTGRRKRKNK